MKKDHKEILLKALNDKSFRQKAFGALAVAILAGVVTNADAMELIGNLGNSSGWCSWHGLSPS